MALLDKLKQLLPGGRGGVPDSTRADKRIDTRIAVTGGILMVSVAAVVVLTILDSENHMQRMTYAKFASEQQIISQEIAINALVAVSRNLNVFSQLENNQKRFNKTILMLDNGDEMMGLPPLPDAYSTRFAAVKNIWQDYNKNISAIVAAKSSIGTVNEYVTQINESMPELISLSNQIVTGLIKTRAPGKNVALASSQLTLIRKLESSLNHILNDHDTPEVHGVVDDQAAVNGQDATEDHEAVLEAADQFSRDVNQIEKQLLAMLKGSKLLGIEKFKGAAIVSRLVKFADLFSVVKKNADELLKKANQISTLHRSALQIASQSSNLLKAASDLASNVRPPMNATSIRTNIAIGIAVFSIIVMITFSFSLVRNSRMRLLESQDQNDKNQRAILRLLDEMTNLADGDLTTHTTVTEDITGAIADSVNYSIDALRDLVGTINKTAVQVGGAVRKTQNTTGQLEEASIAQAKEISSAGSAITRISKSMSKISEKASDSAEVARKSVGIAHNGGETVRQTIAGMETIRQQIQETSKRIKRLGESSQEIGDIVNLITEISDQTNILALNAAIQASMAGEAGRGFAVVADEVQRLAERTGDATKQIEALVKTIQADTSEASTSMEQSTANVVKGAKLTENAGSALDRIEQVSMNLAQRILEISDTTKAQAAESVKITTSMGVIQQITLKTSEGSGQASNSIGELSSMVDAMRTSVAGFKLPGIEAQNTFVKERDQTGKPG